MPKPENQGGLTAMDIMVCVGSSCHLSDSRSLINRLKELIHENNVEGEVELKGSFCMGHCVEKGVCVKFDERIFGLTVGGVDNFFRDEVLTRIH